ncbi:MAG: zf-HC2 domain-containing protein [Labedaea sp.]
MTEARGSGWGLSEQHLMPDAVVAFVDGELSRTAVDRAASHIAKCPYCAAEISAQRQARAAVRAADTPPPPADLLASLRAIPQETELPTAPDGLAVTEDGQLVTVQRPDRVAPLGSNSPLGSSPKLGEGRAVLGFRIGRRTAQGAGVVVSGLMLGALALMNTGSGAAPEQRGELPAGPIAEQAGVLAQR